MVAFIGGGRARSLLNGVFGWSLTYSSSSFGFFNKCMREKKTPHPIKVSVDDDDVFYSFLQKQKIALEPNTLPPGTSHHEKRKTHTCDDVTAMTLMVQW